MKYATLLSSGLWVIHAPSTDVGKALTLARAMVDQRVDASADVCRALKGKWIWELASLCEETLEAGKDGVFGIIDVWAWPFDPPSLEDCLSATPVFCLPWVDGLLGDIPVGVFECLVCVSASQVEQAVVPNRMRDAICHDNNPFITVDGVMVVGSNCSDADQDVIVRVRLSRTK